MKILVDADACPVKNLIEEIAENYQLLVVLVCNSHHIINSNYSKVMIVDDKSQSADIAILNNTNKGDIVITNDYGLAAVALGKGAFTINFSGVQYDLKTIDYLLMQRYVKQKARQSGQKVSGPKKRSDKNNIKFKSKLIKLIEENVNIT
ncbi:hypothetical protein SYNTR_0995 [Candidatus Syntrophocurvum alkaliphilum]|uniref:UPF0178 protein SYNTR_0995 n=1 Tax=Candidatus Syntrophocurvum alkaliphilum TaxID=2293317 RepID=A0A6I6D9N5_9FIRM|nr:YaiI/YqxD family protein [Candidatus Syntrophocurvum alkaliphilum]QGT99588.1 hypothetical protein SYNTR_0995 [Candidatus Syntrophocurvum alkaliphilum]